MYHKKHSFDKTNSTQGNKYESKFIKHRSQMVAILFRTPFLNSSFMSGVSCFINYNLLKLC